MSSVGLDVGGTYVKAAWLEAGPLRVLRREIPDFIDVAGKAREIDPGALMDAIRDLLNEVIRGRPCDRLLITGQMAGLALVDVQGRPLAPLISWQDTRVDDVESVRTALSLDELIRLGDGLRVGLPLVTLSKLEVPHGAFVTSLIGFVAGDLVGHRASTIQATDAASLGLLDVTSCRWSQAALTVARIEETQLPRPVLNPSIVGTASQFGARVITPVGDQQAALMGAGLAQDEVSMNIATGCQVSKLTDVAQSPVQLRPFFHGRYLQTVTHLPAGRLLTAAVRQDLGHPPSNEEWEGVMQQAGDVSTATGRAVDAIASACVDAAKRLGSSSEIVFSGGVAQKADKLRELIAGTLCLPYRVYGGDDAALEGLRLVEANYFSSSERI